MPWNFDGDYIPDHMTQSTPTVSLEGMLRKLKEDRLQAALPNFKKESEMLLDAFDRKKDCPPVPGLDQITISYITRMYDYERQCLAWICWQIGGTPHRGEIGFTDKGEMVFHLVIEREDQKEKMEMVTWDEVWIVMDPPSCLTSAYGG